MTALAYVYADAADPATGVVVRGPWDTHAYHGTICRIEGTAWVIDQANTDDEIAGEVAADAAASGIVLPRIVLVTRSPNVRLI